MLVWPPLLSSGDASAGGAGDVGASVAPPAGWCAGSASHGGEGRGTCGLVTLGVGGAAVRIGRRGIGRCGCCAYDVRIELSVFVLSCRCEALG